MAEKVRVQRFKVVKKVQVELHEWAWLDDSFWRTREEAKERQEELLGAGVVAVVDRLE